jgi:hypothetical protein
MKTVLFAIALAACGGSQPQPSPPPATATAPGDAAVDASRADPAASLAKMSQFSDEMCKCVDRECAERVTEAMTRWAQEMVTRHSDEVTMSDSDTRRMAQISERIATCVTDAMMRGNGPGSNP